MTKCKVGLIGNYFVNWLILNTLKLKVKKYITKEIRRYYETRWNEHTGMF